MPTCWPGISMPASIERFLNDLAEIRLAVEPRTAALAAARRSEADIAELRRAWSGCGGNPPNSVGFADADLALHLAVANASGNLFMRSIGNVIEAALRASFLLSAPVETGGPRDGAVWHQRIVDAIAAGDAEAASDAMIEVIHNGMRRHEGIGDRVRSTGRARLLTRRVENKLTEFRIAIVGFGKIARDQHVPRDRRDAGVVLAAVADPQRLARRCCRISRPSRSCCVTGPPIDAVALCTPPQVRRAQAAAALAAGKHVMLEKPPGATVAELDPLIGMATRRTHPVCDLAFALCAGG